MTRPRVARVLYLLDSEHGDRMTLSRGAGVVVLGIYRPRDLSGRHMPLVDFPIVLLPDEASALADALHSVCRVLP